MTQEQINNQRARNNKLYEEFKKTMAVEYKKLNDLYKNCDHKYPNGSSAWNNSFMVNSCDICGDSD